MYSCDSDGSFSVVRIGWSRDDVEVAVDGMTFPPAAGLGSWAAFMATGEPAALAGGVKAMWDAIRQVRRKSPKPADRFAGPMPRPGEARIDPKPIERITGLEAAVNPGGVVKVSVGREARIDGAAFGGSMGLTTWAAFSGADDLAAMDGDFAMSAGEVGPVLRALRKADIHVVALHNHMIGEEPAFSFVHFWSVGPAGDLAAGFKAALDAQR